jgi:hypothetical protein
MEDKKNYKNVFVWSSKRRGHFGNDIINGKIILKLDPRETCMD